jgi:predicted RND superfamily exporter protein
MRSTTTILTEAFVIALMNVALYYMFRKVTGHVTSILLAGAFIHIGFEFAGLNEWWCKVTYPPTSQ